MILRDSILHTNGFVRSTILLCTVVFLFIFAGCKPVGINYTPPEPNVPDIWANKLVEAGQSDGGISKWWQTFNDPMLEGLIEESLQNNLDIRAALSRIDEARYLRAVAAGEKSIQVDASGFYRQGKASENGLEVVPGAANDRTNLHNVGLDASWEIDVFGRIKRSVESADASYQATIEDYHDVEVILSAEVASAYVNVRTLQARLYYAQGNVMTQKDTLTLTKDRFKAQIVPEIDVRQAELNLARTESSIPTLELQIEQAIYSLSVLLGREPGYLRERLSSTQPMPQPSDILAIGIPAEVVRSRPDIRRAERFLAAQTAKVGVATADLYPRFSLSGSFAFEGTQLKHLGYEDSKRWTWGPSINWSLFNGDRLKNNLAAEKSRTEQALIEYQRIVLRSLQEVESSLTAYSKEQSRKEIVSRSVEAAKKSVELVSDLYKSGLTDFQNVLDTEKSLFEQQDAYASSSGLVLQNLIEVYRSAGGGWDPLAQAETP